VAVVVPGRRIRGRGGGRCPGWWGGGGWQWQWQWQCGSVKVAVDGWQWQWQWLGGSGGNVAVDGWELAVVMWQCDSVSGGSGWVVAVDGWWQWLGGSDSGWVAVAVVYTVAICQWLSISQSILLRFSSNYHQKNRKLPYPLPQLPPSHCHPATATSATAICAHCHNSLKNAPFSLI
jgi:hypothetical protein